jgi:hypothetical protein
VRDEADTFLLLPIERSIITANGTRGTEVEVCNAMSVFRITSNALIAPHAGRRSNEERDKVI